MSQLNRQAWRWLECELDLWSERDLTANFWWRDDDACKPTPKLERLANLSVKHLRPLALAVIPGQLNPSLANFLDPYPLLSILQHGYSHSNHAPMGQRKLELGGNRNQADIISDLEAGKEILRQHFEARFKSVLVPPWNRIDNAILGHLTTIGFTGISTMKVRRKVFASAGLLRVNTHLDPVNWRHGGGFIGVYPAVAILIQHLVSKRMGYRDRDEPTGLLTHHLVQNDAVWQFTDQLFQVLKTHPAVCWCDARDIWP